MFGSVCRYYVLVVSGIYSEYYIIYFQCYYTYSWKCSNIGIVFWATVSPPEGYLGSSDLEVYKMFITGILWWLRLHGILGVNYTKTHVQFLGTRLKGNASEWFTRNIECPGWPIKYWSLESVIEGLQKIFLNSIMHRQASNKFNTIKQG